MTSSRPELTLVVPTFNEAERISRTLHETAAWMTERSFESELIVVDDGSTDATARLVARAAERDPRVRLLRHPRNRGKGAAVRCGMLAARGRTALFMDADLATPLVEHVKLARALEGGAEVAIGVRYHAGAAALDRTWTRDLLGRGFRALVRAATGTAFVDTQCGFKLFRAEAARALFARQTIDGFAFDVEILQLAASLGYRIAEVPVRWRDQAGSTVSPLRDAVRMLGDVLALSGRAPLTAR